MPFRTLQLSRVLNIKEFSGGTHGRASRASRSEKTTEKGEEMGEGGKGGAENREKRRVVVLGKSRAMVIFPLADVQNHASPRPPSVVSYRHSFLPSAVLVPVSSALPATRTYARTHARTQTRVPILEDGGEREREINVAPSFA